MSHGGQEVPGSEDDVRQVLGAEPHRYVGEGEAVDRGVPQTCLSKRGVHRPQRPAAACAVQVHQAARQFEHQHRVPAGHSYDLFTERESVCRFV